MIADPTSFTIPGSDTSLFRFADRIPPEIQARTWVCSDSERTPWSVLPLHKALAHGAPYRVIERLVSLYPESVRLRDFRGRLPVEVSVQQLCADDVVEYLFCAYPDAVLNKWFEHGRFSTSTLTRLDCQMLTHEVIQSYIRVLVQEESSVYSVADDSEPGASLTTIPLEREDSTLTATESLLASASAEGVSLILQRNQGKRQVAHDGNECPPLYKLIEARSWPLVDKLLKSEDVDLTPQVRTWIYRRGEAESDSWSLLPAQT